MDNLIYNDGKALIFPLTKEEKLLFESSSVDFAKYINLNVFCELKKYDEQVEIWAIVKIEQRAIVGYATKQEEVVSLFVDDETKPRAKKMFEQYEKEFNIKLDYRNES